MDFFKNISLRNKKNTVLCCALFLFVFGISVLLCSSCSKPAQTPVQKTEETNTTTCETETKPKETSTTTTTTTTATTNTKAPSTTTKAPVVTTHTHVYAKTGSVAATCTTEGSETFTCSCGNSYTNKVKTIGHVYTKWTVTVEATTTSTGTKECKCDICGGAPIYETIPVKVETAGIDPRIEVVKVTNFGPAYTRYLYGKCVITDRRTWGSITEISIIDEMNLHLVYYNKNNERVEVNVSTPFSDYTARCTISDDGTFVVDLIGAFS